MYVTIEVMSTKAQPRGLPPHPWAKWFKSRWVTLQRGKDFNCEPHSLAMQARRKAGQLEIKVTTEVRGNTVRIKCLS